MRTSRSFVPTPYPDDTADRFLALQDKLHRIYPETRQEAETLSSRVLDPRNASPSAVWTKLWDKPIFAANRSGPAAAKVEALRHLFDVDWTIIPHSAEYAFQRNQPGEGQKVRGFHRSKAAYSAVGSKAEEAMNHVKLSGLRYHAIVDAARWLGRQKAILPIADFPDAELAELVTRLTNEIGHNWAHITVLHFLTDLGIACKPDLHLTAAARLLGLTKTQSSNPKLPEALEIVSHVKTLTGQLYGIFEPAKLRYVDKTLMQISEKIMKTSKTSAI